MGRENSATGTPDPGVGQADLGRGAQGGSCALHSSRGCWYGRIWLAQHQESKQLTIPSAVPITAAARRRCLQEERRSRSGRASHQRAASRRGRC